MEFLEEPGLAQVVEPCACRIPTLVIHERFMMAKWLGMALKKDQIEAEIQKLKEERKIKERDMNA